MAEEEDKEGQEENPQNNNMKIIIIVGVVFVLLMSISIASVLILLGGEEEVVVEETAQTEVKEEKVEEAPKEEAKKEEPKPELTVTTTKSSFVSIRPGFVVNLKSSGKKRYLQVAVDLMVADDASVRDIVKEYMPLIKHELNLLFANKTYDQLQSLDGRKNLNKEAEELLQKIFTENVGNPVVKRVLFTKFITQ